MTLPVTYSAAEVATSLKRSPRWVRQQARSGAIPHSVIGGDYRFTAEHVAEILAARERRPAAEPVRVPGMTPRSRRRTA